MTEVHSQTNSLVVTAIDLCSALAEDLETIACFLVFQEMGEPPKSMKYPIKDRHESRHVPQSES